MFYQKLVSATEAATADTVVQIPNSGGGSERIVNLFATNTGNSAVRLYLYVVPKGGSASPSTCLMYGIDLPQNETLTLQELEAPRVPSGYKLMAWCSGQDQVNITVSLG